MSKIIVFGVELPEYQDCTRCGQKDACRFATYTYDQPCRSCKSTPAYEAEQHQSKKPGITEAFKSKQVAGVFEGKGRTFFTNHKGDVIRDEKTRPLPVGKKDWR